MASYQSPRPAVAGARPVPPRNAYRDGNNAVAWIVGILLVVAIGAAVIWTFEPIVNQIGISSAPQAEAGAHPAPATPEPAALPAQ